MIIATHWFKLEVCGRRLKTRDCQMFDICLAIESTECQFSKSNTMNTSVAWMKFNQVTLLFDQLIGSNILNTPAPGKEIFGSNFRQPTEAPLRPEMKYP